MARKEVIQYFDDLDNSPLTKEEVEIVHFSLGNKEYELDLSSANAEKFRELLQPYLEHARRVNVPQRRRRRQGNYAGGAAAYGIDPADVRAWAESNGIPVNQRGKIKTETVERYREAKGLA